MSDIWFMEQVLQKLTRVEEHLRVLVAATTDGTQVTLQPSADGDKAGKLIDKDLLDAVKAKLEQNVPPAKATATMPAPTLPAPPKRKDVGGGAMQIPKDLPSDTL